MDWIFDHIQLIIIIGSSIAWWLTQQRQQNADDEDKPSPHERPGRQRIDWERQQEGGESDAARQVRERMRRLRDQRRQGSPAPTSTPTSQPRRAEPTMQDLPPVLRELMGIPEPEPEPAPKPVVPPPVPQESRADRMAREMRELEAKQREAEAMASRVRGQIGGASGKRRRSRRGQSAHRGDVLSDQSFLQTLRDPRSARRAILLKEVLDRPVGLR